MPNRIIQAELKKSHRTFVAWITLMGSLLVPVVCFLIYLFRWRHFIPNEGMNAWDNLSEMILSLSASLVFPFLVILFVALNLNLEKKADSWKKLYIMPVRRGLLFWGKLMFLVFQLLVCIVLLFLSIPLIGLVLDLFHPELAFLKHPLDIVHLLQLCLEFFVSLLAILSVQYLLSLLFDNIIVPITVGMMMVIVSIVLVQGWEYIRFDPYAFPLLLFRDEGEQMAIPYWLGIRMTNVLSVVYFFVVSFCSMAYFKRRTVK